MDLRLELVTVPVSDIDRAKAFTPSRLGSAWTRTCRSMVVTVSWI